MKKYSALCCLLVGLACQPSNPYQASQYFSEKERDTLLTNIITYVYAKAPGATNDTRFQSQYRKFYVTMLPSFYLENYYIAPDSTHYFFMIRPVGNHPTQRRGVLGKFKLKSLMPVEFEEIANTPRLEEEVLRQRGHYLFKELIKNGNLNPQLSMKHYIEWPDSTLRYDKQKNEWVSTFKN